MAVTVPEQTKVAPCQAACPAGIDVPRYVRQIAAGRYSDALATVRERIPFPLVCGYACFHPCEAKCGRAQYDAPVAIRMLKRAAAELGADVAPPAPLPATGRRIAVIGSGPCGLTAACYVALLGHEATVFEALHRPGGMLRYGIPGYRLPDAVVDADIRFIERCGVAIVTGKRIASAEALLEQGYDAVFIATGAWRPARLGIPGERGQAVLDGLSFLEAVNAGSAPALGASVLVVGGGDTAIDAARVSRRLGAEVVILYRRTRADMPASPEEIEAAIEEGVAIEAPAAPLRIEGDVVTCARMAADPADAGARPRLRPVPGSEFTVRADTVIVAIGQRVDAPTTAVAREDDGRVRTEARTLATSAPGIFAGGDAASGPASIIDAIAHGRMAASAIDRFVGGDGNLDRLCPPGVDVASPEAAPRGAARERWVTLERDARLQGFEAVERGYDERAAQREAGRCLSCDRLACDVRIDPALCKECGYCSEVCAPGVFERSDDFNAGGYRPFVAARPGDCVGCLRCLYICPDFAITVS